MLLVRRLQAGKISLEDSTVSCNLIPENHMSKKMKLNISLSVSAGAVVIKGIHCRVTYLILHPRAITSC